ncbi:MAG: hypothetical protein WCV62_06125 [Candidatus Peribacteraceae bacterium]|jgi:hypothetical protein
MSDFGGPESFAPGEGGGNAPEQLSEEARQRFAASAAAMKAIQREEKRSRKRDDRVARTIIQFLNDERYTHLFVLISRLVARDCPSIFTLAILSLISDESKTVVQDYLKETGQKSEAETVGDSLRLTKGGEMDAASHARIVEWITRMQMVLSLEAVPILTRLMVDEHTIDGTVLQLTTFVLQDFFSGDSKKKIPFEKLHSFTASVLQTVFEPFMDAVEKRAFRKPTEENDRE